MSRKLVVQVTPDQGSQADQTASEQRKETRFWNHRRLSDSGCRKGIRSQNQNQQNHRAQVSH
jgi:hypothetical protein